jgi:hypothetical protein
VQRFQIEITIAHRASASSSEQQHGEAEHDRHVCHIEDAGSERAHADIEEIDHTASKQTVHPVRRTARQNEARSEQQPPTPPEANRDSRQCQEQDSSPSENNAVRADGGNPAPRLRNPPVFSTYSSRIVSARYDRPGSPASAALATCLVTRSHPIVATTAISSSARTPVLAIILESHA